MACRPALETTDSLTPPFWMYSTLPPASPCENMVADRRYRTTFLATPAESRNACASKVFMLC